MSISCSVIIFAVKSLRLFVRLVFLSDVLDKRSEHSGRELRGDTDDRTFFVGAMVDVVFVVAFVKESLQLKQRGVGSTADDGVLPIQRHIDRGVNHLGPGRFFWRQAHLVSSLLPGLFEPFPKADFEVCEPCEPDVDSCFIAVITIGFEPLTEPRFCVGQPCESGVDGHGLDAVFLFIWR